MSDWDAYLGNLRGHCEGACDTAAIIGLDGSIWTTTSTGEGIAITQPEATAIGAAFQAQDFGTFMASGIHIAGVKYNFLRELEGMVLGKMKEQGAISMQGTKTAVVIGHTAEGQQQGSTNKGVGVIAEYLESLGM